jgi:hypothetical protein
VRACVCVYVCVCVCVCVCVEREREGGPLRGIEIIHTMTTSPQILFVDGGVPCGRGRVDNDVDSDLVVSVSKYWFEGILTHC